jgi:hypothetical protein
MLDHRDDLSSETSREPLRFRPLGNARVSKGLGAFGERGLLCAPTAHQKNGINGVSPEIE